MAEYQRKQAEKTEVEKIEVEKAEFKKQESKVLALCKANTKVQKEAKAKMKKEAVMRSGSEKAEGSKKCGQEDDRVEISVTIRSFLTEHGVEWMVKEKVMCESWRRERKNVFGGQGKACLACHEVKKSCVAGGAEESETEASPLKKMKVEGKGKVKVNWELRSPELWSLLQWMSCGTSSRS